MSAFPVLFSSQIFDPLDFLAELTQHIPNQGEHLIRYYGCYSNKARGLARKQNATPTIPPAAASSTPSPLSPSPADRLLRRRWAILIKRIYHADPLTCPKCGSTMKIIAFIEARQNDVIRKILQHCGLWQDPRPRPPPRPPPSPSSRAQAPKIIRPPVPQASRRTPVADIDPEFLEHLHREAQAEQLHLSWD